MLVMAAVPAFASPPGGLAPAPDADRVNDPGIDLAPDPARDGAIERRLLTIFAELPNLTEVEVEVEAGVVHLAGTVLAANAAAEAESIARRIEGVVAVNNRIEQVYSLGRRLRPLADSLRARGLDFLLFLPLLLAGLVIIGAAWLVARLTARLTQRRRTISRNVFVSELAGQLVRASIMLFGVVIAFELMGATALIGALLGTAGVVGLALGFAFKDMAENYIASILLSLRQPFEPNDYIEVGGHEGTVLRLTSRATVLLTLDGNHVRIPNAAVFKGTIINYTRNPERRFRFTLGVAVEADLSKVQALACSTIAATPGVLASPAPASFVEEFGDSAMIISISGWLDQREADWTKVSSEARRRIKVAFERAGIDVPEPIFRVRNSDFDSEVAVRAPSGEAIESAADTDVRPDQHMRKRVADEREAIGGVDLLSMNAPIE
jgi:small conductance mechanosensitive channel